LPVWQRLLWSLWLGRWNAGPRGRILVCWTQKPTIASGHRRFSGNEDENVKTYSPKASEIERAWHIVDAEGLVLGRMATEVARILRGKHKPTFAPHMDCGDHVIIINADKVVLTNDKAGDKMMYRHTGYPGGIKSTTYADLLAAKPAEAVRGSVRGMIPKNRLGRQVMTKLKVYPGPVHPHSAQKPQPLVLEQARAREAS
jgi:large subunit ribosomal protein L13